MNTNGILFFILIANSNNWSTDGTRFQCFFIIKLWKVPILAGFSPSRYFPAPPGHAGRETRVPSLILWRNFCACFAGFALKAKRHAIKAKCTSKIYAGKIFQYFLFSIGIFLRNIFCEKIKSNWTNRDRSPSNQEEKQ